MGRGLCLAAQVRHEPSQRIPGARSPTSRPRGISRRHARRFTRSFVGRLDSRRASGSYERGGERAQIGRLAAILVSILGLKSFAINPIRVLGADTP